MSSDVQGAKLDGLVGCDRLLDDIVKVQVKANFEELWGGQKLFTDIHHFMHDNGLALMHIDGFAFDPGPLPPLGAAARGSWASGEVLTYGNWAAATGKLGLVSKAFG